MKVIKTYIRKYARNILSKRRQSYSKKEYESPFLDPSINKEYKDICIDLKEKGLRLKFTDITNYTVYNVLSYILDNNIEGDLVECGVASGIKVRIMCELLVRRGIKNRDVYLYDTFTGMTKPCSIDRKLVYPTGDILKQWRSFDKGEYNEWCYSSLDDVKKNIFASGYTRKKIHFIKGDVLNTIPNSHHNSISLLRLDTDFYESSKHELNHLYDKVVRGGVIILDDYGAWEGQKTAADEFFGARNERLLLHRTCRKERVIMKY